MNSRISTYLINWIIIVISTIICISCNTDKIQHDGEKNGGLFLPDGFEAVVVVNQLKGQARHIAINNNGDIYVKLRTAVKEHGNAVLRDNDGDGRADLIKYFGNYPIYGSYGTGMRIHNGYLYYSSQMQVYRQKLTKGKMIPDNTPELIVQDTGEKSRREHIGKPIAFDGKGNMFVPFGAPSNACQNPKRTPGAPGQDPCPLLDTYAGIWKFKEDVLNQTQAEGEKYASGIRSLVCLEWDQGSNGLYTVMHGRDDLLRMFPGTFTPWQSALLPAEEFLRVESGDHFGWPYCFYDQLQGKKVLAPEYGGDGTEVGRCSEYKDPIFGFPGHWAPNDLLFYDGDQFPARYKEGAFVAFHGSTNRAPYPQSGYIVAFIPMLDGLPAGDVEIFADGFARVDTIVSVKDAVFRPMGLSQGPNGSLYIAETEHGAIWKISYTGDKKLFDNGALAAMNLRKGMNHFRTPKLTEDNLQKETTDEGEFVYYTYCGTCHQSDGEGDGARFPTLVNTDWVTGDKNRLIRIILEGMEGEIIVNGTTFSNVMPQHSFLSDKQIADVLTYIRQGFGNNASSISTSEVKELKESLIKEEI